jgi:hypothetical protein
MWNSNSTISWLMTRSGLDVESIQLPQGGRAPGWIAGIVVARRQVPKELESEAKLLELRHCGAIMT